MLCIRVLWRNGSEEAGIFFPSGQRPTGPPEGPRGPPIVQGGHIGKARPPGEGTGGPGRVLVPAGHAAPRVLLRVPGSGVPVLHACRSRHGGGGTALGHRTGGLPFFAFEWRSPHNEGHFGPNSSIGVACAALPKQDTKRTECLRPPPRYSSRHSGMCALACATVCMDTVCP